MTLVYKKPFGLKSISKDVENQIQIAATYEQWTYGEQINSNI